MTAQPFYGLRVLEVAGGLAGLSAGALLAGLGADVTQVVPEGAPAPDAPERVWSDRLKGRAPSSALRALADGADVVMTDLPSAAAARLGLDAVTVRTRNDQAVHVWLPPLGTRGRWIDLAADALLLSAVSGYAQHHPADENRPIAPATPFALYLHGALGATSAAAGLLARRSEGRGRSVTVTGLHAMGSILLTLMIGGGDSQKISSTARSTRGAPFFRLYQAGDGAWFYMAALSPAIFFRALEAIDRMDVMVRDDVAGEFSNLLVPGPRDGVNGDLESTFASRPLDHWLSILRAADVPVAPVWDRPTWMASGITGTVTDGPVTSPAFPMTFSPTGGTIDLTVGATMPLEGLRVVDLSTFLAGPFASALLASFGADVTKFESVDGDPYRVFSTAHSAVNQHKSVAAIDLRHPRCRRALLDSIGSSHVLVDNLQPGSLERLDLGPDAIAAANPSLVRCTVSAFGPSGPWAGLPGFDPILQSLSGLAATQGGPGRPAVATAPVVDVATGALAALGILAALYGGTGTRVETSLAAAATFIQSAEVTDWPGRPSPPLGAPDFVGPTPSHRYYRASDGWVAINAGCDLTALLGASDGPSLEAIFAAEPAIHWIDLLSSAGVAAVAVLGREGAIDDPYLDANAFSHEIDIAELGRFRVAAAYADWEGTANRPGRGHPLGAGTDDVLRRAGVTEDEMAALAAEGAVTRSQ